MNKETSQAGPSKTEYTILTRQLTASELRFLNGLGLRGSPSPDIRRTFLALLCDGQYEDRDLLAEDIELLRFLIKYPEELRKALRYIPLRTQPYVIRQALQEHYLARNNGRMLASIYASGTRRTARWATG